MYKYNVFQDWNVNEPEELGNDELGSHDGGIEGLYGIPLGFRNMGEASEIGKRAPYGFGIGKRRYSFGLNKRDPYSFGIGIKIRAEKSESARFRHFYVKEILIFKQIIKMRNHYKKYKQPRFYQEYMAYFR